MKKCFLYPLVSLLCISCGAYAAAQTDNSGVANGNKASREPDPTNAVTGKVTIPKNTWVLRSNLTFVTNADGQVSIITNQVMVTRKSAKKPVPIVRVTTDGAVGRDDGIGHSVEFSGNLNSSDSVIMHLPPTAKGPVTLKGHVICVGLIDSKGKQVILGTVRDCSGEILASSKNVVRWANAFSGIKADAYFIFQSTFMEQLIVLRENPVIPPEIDQATAKLFVMSEFYEAPEPRKEIRTVKLRTDPALEKQHGAMVMQDELLDWGWMRMAEGQAFVWPQSSGAATVPRVPTSKLWFKDGQRRFLVEYADYQSLKPALEGLASIFPKSG